MPLTRSDILQHQALIRGVKKLLTRVVCQSQFWKMDKRQTDRQKEKIQKEKNKKIKKTKDQQKEDKRKKGK